MIASSGPGSEFAGALRAFARDIADCLAAAQTKDGEFPGRDFYGKAFSALLWSNWPEAYAAEIDRALSAVSRDEKPMRGADKYHFEFNRYALLTMGLPHKEVNALLGGERYARTRVANWTLLRACCRLRSPDRLQRIAGKIEIYAVNRWFVKPDWLIEDQREAFTAQYHAFCSALLFEVDRLLGGGPASRREACLRGVADNICRLTMPDGQCNYLGRGSYQSFGYGAAILALCRAARRFGDPVYSATAQRIFSYVGAYRRADGSVPLVLSPSGREEGPPDRSDRSPAAYAGWYSYNNYFDYLPFLGALLALAASELEEAVEVAGDDERRPDCGEPARKVYRSGIVVVAGPGYRAVVSLPNAAWASSQPVPYVGLHGGGCPLPSYGGEDRPGGLHSASDVPVPVMMAGGDRLLCDPGSYYWSLTDVMRGKWPHGAHERRFSFEEKSIRITDTVTNTGGRIWECHIVRLPLIPGTYRLDGGEVGIGDSIRISGTAPLERLADTVYGPDGPMDVIGVARPLEPGGTVAETIAIRF